MSRVNERGVEMISPGFQYEVKSGERSAHVIYTTHFIERYYRPRFGLSSPSALISEDIIREKITEAADQILDILESVPKIEGVIQSAKYKLAMAFACKQSSKGQTLIMQSMMLNPNYHPKGVRDYLIEINPPVEVRFRKGISAPLREAVLAELIPELSSLEDDASYHLEGELIQYWVERFGDVYYIDDADWLYDIYEVHVH